MIDQIEFETNSETNNLKTHNVIAQNIGKNGETEKNKVIIITMIILLSVIRKAKLKITLIIIIFIRVNFIISIITSLFYHVMLCSVAVVFCAQFENNFSLLLTFFVFHFAQQFIGLLFQLINDLCLHNVSLLPSKTFHCRIDVIDSFPDQICQGKIKVNTHLSVWLMDRYGKISV